MMRIAFLQHALVSYHNGCIIGKTQKERWSLGLCCKQNIICLLIGQDLMGNTSFFFV